MSVVWIVLGIVSIIYGISIMAIQSGSNFYLVWFAGACFFFALALNRRFHFWQLLPDFLRKILAVGFFAGLFLLLVVEMLILSTFRATPKETCDYMIVLGAQVKESGPSLVLQYRLDTAIAYLTRHPEVPCIVSGGKGKNEPFSEAEGMCEYLVEHGIERERILLEDTSKNTVQNMQFSMQYLNPETDKVCIVTNNFHMFRALKLAKKQGIKQACGLAAPSTVVYLPQNMLREFCGVMKDFLFGNL